MDTLVDIYDRRSILIKPIQVNKHNVRSFVTLIILALLIGISITNGYVNSMNVVND